MKNVQQRMNCNIFRARAKRGMFEGDLIEGELEIGQIAGLIQEVKSAEGIYGRLQCGKTRNSCYFFNYRNNDQN
jgi:hypothetical protein